jgi:plasmid stabilization system protein ParE
MNTTVSRDSQNYAAAFVGEVKDAAESLAHFAARGQVVPELGQKDVRELLVAPYRLVYRITDVQVQILTLIHGARRSNRF